MRQRKRIGSVNDLPLPSTLYLPTGVSLGHLVNLLHATPELTVAEITRTISRQRPLPIPDEQLLIMDLVLHGMQLTEQRLIALVLQQQQEMRRLGVESEEAGQQAAGFQHNIGSLMHRPHTSAQPPSTPVNLTNIPAEVDVIDGYGHTLSFEERVCLDLSINHAHYRQRRIIPSISLISPPMLKIIASMVRQVLEKMKFLMWLT